MVRHHPASTADLHPVALGATELLARHTTAGMAVVTPSGRIRFANPALCHLAERGLPDETGLDELLTTWSWERLCHEALPQARADGYWQGELALTGRGVGRPLQWHLVADTEDAAEWLALVHPVQGPPAEACDCRPLGERLALPLTGETRLVAPEEVRWIAAEGQYTRLREGDGELLVCESLNALLGRLDHPAFARTHRSWVVNLRRVRALVRRGEQYYLRLADEPEVEVPVSRRRLGRVRRVLGLPGSS